MDGVHACMYQHRSNLCVVLIKIQMAPLNWFGHCPVMTLVPIYICYCFTLAHHSSQREDTGDAQYKSHCWQVAGPTFKPEVLFRTQLYDCKECEPGICHPVFPTSPIFFTCKTDCSFLPRALSSPFRLTLQCMFCTLLQHCLFLYLQSC